MRTLVRGGWVVGFAGGGRLATFTVATLKLVERETEVVRTAARKLGLAE